MTLLVDDKITKRIPLNIQKVLDDFLGELRTSSYKDLIESVRLFGASAKNNDSEDESEIDLYVVKKTSSPSLEIFLDNLGRKISEKYGRSIFILDREIDLYKDPIYRKSLFYQTLQKDSILLYNN